MSVSTFPAAQFAAIVMYAALVLAAIFVVLAIAKKSVPTWAMVVLGVLELGLVAVAVQCLRTWSQGTPPAEPFVFVCYLIVCLVLPPGMIVWAKGEPGRWGSGAAAVACVVLAVLIIRVTQVWVGGIVQ